MKKNTVIEVSDLYQKNYKYIISESEGESFHKDFNPDLSPQDMLEIGVFGGKYLSPESSEFPSRWFKNAKLSEIKNPQINFFKIEASMSLTHWQKKGWIYHQDPRGWFQWYCRYYIGRRIPGEDERQIKRWKAMSRHVSQVRKNCSRGDLSCRPRQRQVLLHWAYDSRLI